MQCSSETIARIFYNVSSSFQLLFIFFYFTSIFLFKFFYFLGGNPFFRRNQDGYEFDAFSDEEGEDETEDYHANSIEKEHLVADIIHGGEKLMFLPTRSTIKDGIPASEMESQNELLNEETEEDSGIEEASLYSSPVSEYVQSDEEMAEEEILARDTDSFYDSERNENDPTLSVAMNSNKNGPETDKDTHEEYKYQAGNRGKKLESNLTQDENFLVFAPSKLEGKNLHLQEKEDEGIFGDSFTIGSTSKDSSEWRSSIKTEDPFSSSSRRSCPKWESYTIFQKYDEEMLFLDRISAQKLHETESLKSIQTCPRSISERIVHKLATRNKSSSDYRHNPYHELEAAYVAQICLTWEALHWNYKYFQRLRAARRELDPGCPAYIAQQFQQFQVLLQRYIENEPYEHGKRPEIYARMRSLAPKLLQVPEYRDSDEEKIEEGFCSRISSDSFLPMMEESIRTFMNFLKADKENHCQILAAFFRRNRRGSADPTLLLLLKKVNKKKKSKIKEMRRSKKCLRKRRLREVDEMEILMALIDLKVVSRVLRMSSLTDEQLHWCEDKMSKVRVSDGKLQRDSSPLFFPAH